MIKFSLSRAKQKVAPETMVLPDGREVPVNADFRVILKCLRTLKDRQFTDAQKEAFISLYFFNGLGVRNPSHLLNQFLSDGTESEGDGDPPVMDFEQDADVIYSSFMQSYGIDLIDIPFLHWSKFKALVAGLGDETALGRRVSLRLAETSKLPPDKRAKLERAQRRVQLNAAPMTDEEERLQNALNEALENGEDTAMAVRALKEYYDRMGGET